MEFWNDPIIDKSHRLLMDMKKSFDFVLIGGWATYLYTGAIKSKDIDIIVDFSIPHPKGGHRMEKIRCFSQ